MKIAIVSDVHGNLAALEAALAEAERLGAGEVWTLGDVVGYGPEPEPCISRLRSAASVNLMGNHDAAVVDLTPVEVFNGNARRAVEWTRTVLGPEAAGFLSGLPYQERRGEVLLVHASPEDPPAWHYILSVSSAERSFRFFGEKVCFIGHTHVPFIVSEGEGGRVEVIEGGRAELRAGRRYLVNTGSVGQPRDGDPRASFAIFDRSAGTIEIHRTSYAVEKTQDLMRTAGLPAFLIERLSQGR